jgi:hypothetical protein
MILTAGSVDVDPQQRDSALEAGRELFEATRAQDGCLDYVWADEPPLRPGLGTPGYAGSALPREASWLYPSASTIA